MKTPRHNTVPVLVLIIGPIAAFLLATYGVGQLLGTFWHGPTVAICNDRIMSPDEFCHVNIDAASANYTYDQQLHNQRLEYNVYRYGASFVIVAVLTFVIVRYLYNRPSKSTRKARKKK